MAMRHVPVSMCHEKKASSMTRASSALYKRLTAPSGARITTGNVPIWNSVPLILAPRNMTNPITHKGRSHSGCRCDSGKRSFWICERRWIVMPRLCTKLAMSPIPTASGTSIEADEPRLCVLTRMGKKDQVKNAVSASFQSE